MIKTAEEIYTENGCNSKRDIIEAMKEYAAQFIDEAARTAVTKGRFNKNLVEKEKQILKEQLK